MTHLQPYYPYLLYLAVAVAAILLGESLYVALSRSVGRRRGINRRLRALEEGHSVEEVLIELRRERGISQDGNLEFIGRPAKLLVQSGLKLTLGRFLSLVVVFGVVIFAICFFLAKLSLFLSLLVAILIGPSLPMFIVSFIKKRRQFKFMSQLPDAMDVIVRSLRSGHPIPVAMAMVGRELSDPIGTEFGIAVDEMTYGLDTEPALKNMLNRVGAADLSLLVTAVSLQNATGGNLSEILGNLSKVMRERFQLSRKVRALSAEGRVSAYGLTIMPIAMFLFINFQNPRYYGDAWGEPIFIPAMLAALAWALIGDVIMFKMINFKY